MPSSGFIHSTQMANPVLSIVSPVYQGELLVEPVVKRMVAAANTCAVTFEIILVDDGSSDTTWRKLEEVNVLHPEMKAIRLDKNYGQHAAIRAGLENARGEWVIVMDFDGQDQPEEIPVLFSKAHAGFDSVFALREKRNSPAIKKIYSELFYFLLHMLSGVAMNGRVANFGVYNRTVIRKILAQKRKIFFFPVAARKAATKPGTIITAHAQRVAGKTTYTFGKAFRLAILVLTGYSVFSFLIRKSNSDFQIKKITGGLT